MSNPNKLSLKLAILAGIAVAGGYYNAGNTFVYAQIAFLITFSIFEAIGLFVIALMRYLNNNSDDSEDYQ